MSQTNKSKQRQEAVRERLAEIEEANRGRLTPEAVVRDAEDPDSPLHDYFEWDNKEAGHRWRIEQARALIVSVRVITTVDRNEVKAVYYVKDPTLPQGQSGYRSLPAIKSERALAREVIGAEVDRVITALERARAIAAVLDLEREVEQLLSQSVNLRQQIEAAPRRVVRKPAQIRNQRS
jgi:hypothetical protein